MNYGYILGIVGRDSFVKGRWYSSDIEKEDTTKLASSFYAYISCKIRIIKKNLYR